MKTIIIPNHKSMIEQLQSLYDGIIIGIKDFSVNVPLVVTLQELDEICKIKEQGKQIFVMLNKNIHNIDLEPLKKVLCNLEQYPIDGIFYYDVSIVHLKKKLHLSKPLIWSQEHLTTNANTCNFWQTQGVEGTYLSNEITLEEIEEIRKNTMVQLFVTIFGFLPMFQSKRHLVKNYLKQFHIESENSEYIIEKEGKKYPIIDNSIGTTVYSNFILNAISEYEEFKKIKIDYVILNSFHIESSIFKQILELLKKENNDKKKIFEQIEQLLQTETDYGFLYKETIYKVKGDCK